jgi:ribosomal protein S18 acetylase RimI-like enzyme
MTAIAWNRSEAAEQGVTPFDARRHLRQVADLIGEAFADELDANGRGAIQEMQWIGRINPFFNSVLGPALFSEFLQGYVWVESGDVVGNVTFQRADMAGTRWRISNVAVAPAFRRHGIARALMEASLHEIAQRGGNWTILQVRVDNPPARRLYTSLGFTDVCQDGIWHRTSRPQGLLLPEAAAASSPIPLRPLGMSVWEDRLELARASRSTLAYWAEPVEADDFRPGIGRVVGEVLGNITGMQRVWRWGAWENGRLMGALEVSTDAANNLYRLRFDVRPESRGQLERALVGQGLRTLATMPPRLIVAEHSGDDQAGVAALESFGFHPQRILLTMRKLMNVE